jgi:hypothetical protein
LANEKSALTMMCGKDEEKDKTFFKITTDVLI